MRKLRAASANQRYRLAIDSALYFGTHRRPRAEIPSVELATPREDVN
jgi:hypothetical protein